MRAMKLCSIGVLAVGCAAGVYAHVRLVHPSNGNPLFWQTPYSISIAVNAVGSDDLADGSHMTAVRNAIDEWNGIDGSTIQLVEDASPGTQARTDWASNSIHLVWWDETNASGYFPNGSGTVAITPVWFFNNGQIVDADVLFNGKGFSFSTSQQPGRYDIQDVAVHELGHLVGLDHTGWAGGSMYPYVDPTVILHRSLSSDERMGMRAVYPDGNHATITGTVRRAAGGAGVAGAHVVVRDSTGRTAAAGLANGGGTFNIGGLDPGTYTLYANPLDFPVSSANLGSGWVVESDFEAALYGTVVVTGNQTQSVGDLNVGADVFLSLGRSSDNYPLRVPSGETTGIVVRGTGLNSGSTLSCSDPTIGVVVTGWLTSQVRAQISVPGGALPGHADLTVVDSLGQRSILPAALEITPPDPVVTLASPNQGDFGGGTAMTISGGEFVPGLRVVMGGEIYEDGAPGGCTVVNSTTITLTTRASAIGATDVVVIDSSGVEGRRANGFQFVAVPTVQTTFPAVGTVAGGTELHITGTNFDLASTVRINGILQPTTFPVADDLLVVMTEPGVAGGPYTVEVQNPGGGSAAGLFTYSAAPDPNVTDITPDTGSASGGETVILTGTNFGNDVTVRFGSDPSTGLGGRPATSVTWLSSTTLEVVTPGLAAGENSVLYVDNSSGQANVLTGGFLVNAVASSGGGGGGCHTTPVQGPPDPGELLRQLAFFAFLVVGVRLVGRRARRASA